jgi:hypothetical protein
VDQQFLAAYPRLVEHAQQVTGSEHGTYCNGKRPVDQAKL